MNILSFKNFKNLIIVFVVTIIFSNAIFQIYENRKKIITKFKFIYAKQRITPVNPLILNKDRQQPPAKIKDLKITNLDADTEGMWSAPVDWNVNTIHLLLLPNGKVMSYGVYGIKDKDNKMHTAENKEIKLTDGFVLERDKGDYQWEHHNVQAGVDFDIWDPNLGYNDESHVVIHRPIVWDAFCSIAKNIDDKNVILLGGNKEPKPDSTDTQAETIFFNSETNEFTKKQKLNYPRWYGSIVRLDTDEFLIVGGHDKTNNVSSITPEILKKTGQEGYYWKPLDGAKSKEAFGKYQADEWSYPKSYLASDGSVVGISYNTLWRLDYKGDGKLKIVGNIPLAKDGFKQVLIEKNQNNPNMEKNLMIGTVGAAVGSTATSVMVEKDKILQIGGWQWDDGKKSAEILADNMAMDLSNEGSYGMTAESTSMGYLPSNHVNLIDFSDTNKPKITRMKNMNYLRSAHDSVLLPNGDVFVHGGVSFRENTNNFYDKNFSVLKPEIYSFKKNQWKVMSEGRFRRNYHSAALLLPDGSVLVGGGDVWNVEVFYPPYLFEKIEDNKTTLAKRPKIQEIDSTLLRGENILSTNNIEDVARITLLSTGSTTHNQNAEMKFSEIKFEKFENNKIKFFIEEDKKVLQKGTYMVFLINQKGVPSKGAITFID